MTATNTNYRKAEKPSDIATVVAEYIKAGNLDGVVSMFHPDCQIFFPPKAGAREQFAPFMELRPTLISTVTSEVIVGDTALLQATWKIEGPDGSIVAEGNSTEVAKRLPNGGWGYYIDCPNGPPTLEEQQAWESSA